MYAKKSLGQHFLKAPAIAAAMVETAEVKKGETVVEVGPGTGILTHALLSAGAQVIAIEKDTRMIPELNSRFAETIKKKQLTIIEGDALELAPPRDSYKIIANIPYYITGSLIRVFLTTKNQPTSVTLLVQKEVAERIAREKKESILSLSVKAYGSPSYIKTVKAGSFSPPPKVDSAILHIADVSRTNFKNKKHEERFFEIVKTGFGQKRKTLSGNVTKLSEKEKVTRVFAELNISTNARAEDIPLATWLRLSEKL